MASSNVVTAEQIEAGKKWTKTFYDVFNSDAFNIERWVTEFYQPDAILKQGIQPPIKGHKEIVARLEEDHKQRLGRHVVKHIDVVSDRIYVRLDGIFIQKNDPEQKEITLQALVVLGKKVDENKLSSIDIFLDPSPLIERIKMLS